MTNSINFLDCTLRDGGYYNNWNFNKNLINEYLQTINSLNIKYVELGFRSLDKKKIKGENAYTTESFIHDLIIPKSLKLGVMINASDLLSAGKVPEKSCKSLFPNIKKTKISFVRLACHINEPFKIEKAIRWLKKNNFMVCINLMQISEIKESEIKKICKFLKNLNVDVLYFADSLGSLKPRDIKRIAKMFQKYWDFELGIHAHNNMELALSNSLEAYKNGVKWVDSTVMGMGRGPGNVRTEEIMKHFINVENRKIDITYLNKLISKHFFALKKKYKWGPNKYYRIAGKEKIHPTYIQEILSDKRYTKENYLNIIRNLKKSDTKKFNPFQLLTSANFSDNVINGNWKPQKQLMKKNILIVGPGNSVFQNKKRIEKFVEKNKIYVISLNTSSNINKKYINLRVACHPLRLMSDAYFHRNTKTDLALPLSIISKKIYRIIKTKNKKILDFGLSIRPTKFVNIKSKYCILPKPLAIGYAIAIAISGKANQIFFAGFDGYKMDDPHNDETNEILKTIKKKYKNRIFFSLTPTKYNLKYKSINSVKF